MNWQHLIGSASAAAAVALAGCSHADPPTPADAPAALSTRVAAAQLDSASLPAPEALTDVLYRLADPDVPGTEKLDLIEGAKPGDAATLDRFTTALKDGGYRPLTLEAVDLGWSDRDPGNAVATVNVTTSSPDTSGFSFPMEFVPHDVGWQLSHRTAELLLAFGKSRVGASAGATPAP